MFHPETYDISMSLPTLLEQLSTYKISQEIRRGIEREALRVTKEGRISQKKHPEALGSALTHPSITTDYAEALLEFVTPVFQDPHKLLDYLEQVHIFTLQNMGDEILWNNSMPCFFKKDDEIQIAQYGKSNVGKMKTIYRHGLKNRYGDVMQTISGIHFNFSLSDHFFGKWRKLEESKLTLQQFRSQKYMSCIRSIHRHSWIIPMLLGSSPAICKSFVTKAPKNFDLVPFDEKGSLTFDGAASMRLSDLGYTNSEQDNIAVCYNDIETYVKGLRKAITEENKTFAKIGVKDGDTYKQLNTFTLQLENEYYAEVRPKRRIHTGESPSNALLDRGVEYIELRSVDVNTFSPIGIELDQVLFLDVFLLFCMLRDCQVQSPEISLKYRANLEKMAKHGRKKDLLLFDGENEVTPREWGHKIFERLYIIAEKLDHEKGSNQYFEVIKKYEDQFLDYEKLPSSRQLQQMGDREETFYLNTLNRSLEFSEKLRGKKLSPEVLEDFKTQSEESLVRQRQIEESDSLSFEEYLKNYFEQNV